MHCGMMARRYFVRAGSGTLVPNSCSLGESELDTSSISRLKCSLDFSLCSATKKAMKSPVIPKASETKSSMPGKLHFRAEYKILKRDYVGVGAILGIGKTRSCLRLNAVNDMKS